ncbi:LAFE_0B03664g1_1 [Lachancea fermentati]|uniref:LAFE_0B03664g1_1 n=1 Tax=Lachancea fermentati TaxID=4955 RepID=A0A1G4M7M0_LACFM|nr:LAFE_0B03664g1_1 [Lachancea fermentati]
MEMRHGHDFLENEADVAAYRPAICQTLPINVRQLVINKQNRRLLPVRDQLIERMEDALVRWRPPMSCHVGSTAALRGKHPYQMEASPKASSAPRPLRSSVKQYFDTLSSAIHWSQPSAILSSSSSSMVDEIRQSVENAGRSNTTPCATAVLDTVWSPSSPPSARALDYNFPVPPYYLQEVQRDYRIAATVGPRAPATSSCDPNSSISLWEECLQMMQETWSDVVAACSCTEQREY